MLIVCPSCATSYMIDDASLGAGGRMVRCARCRATWFAGGLEEKEQQQVSAFVDDVIAEAEAESAEPEPFLRAPAGDPTPAPTVHFGDQPATADVDPPTDQPAQNATAADQPADEAQPPVEGAPDTAPEQHAETDFAPAAAADAAPESDEPAEPAAVEDAPSLVPPMEHAPIEEAEPWHQSNDSEAFAARRRRLKSRRKQAKRSSRWTAIILVLFAFNVALVAGRRDVVRYLPQTASLFAAIGLPVNLQHLKFEDVTIVPNGKSEGLTVEGTIVSTAGTAIKVPALHFAARNAAGQEIYTWTETPTRQMLDPGAKLSFHSELASPPADAKDVLVRFVTPQEAAAMRADAAASQVNTGRRDGAGDQ